MKKILMVQKRMISCCVSKESSEKKILGRFLAPLKKSVKAGELVNLKREIGMRTYTNS